MHFAKQFPKNLKENSKEHFEEHFKKLYEEHMTMGVQMKPYGSHKKNVANRGKVQKGGGISATNQKVQHSKFGLLDKRREVQIFRFFPNLNVDFK